MSSLSVENGLIWPFFWLTEIDRAISGSSLEVNTALQDKHLCLRQVFGVVGELRVIVVLVP
ncbi:hypothetical protein A3F37_04115 [Candidatus Saccharibacteria bacterium RIFCSPHIGHO2_12_FULL_41_12]|nr:MAG: hypothetical protein A3F37_04115 [Candidatus Saccharibacteria bacterium RIFCSPHIGHO2_12_FULL_41_12]